MTEVTNIKAKAISIAGGFTLLQDVAQPIAPFAAYVAGISAISTLILLLVHLFFKAGENLKAAWLLSAATFVLSTGLWGFQQYFDANETGLLASSAPVVADFQQAIGIAKAIQADTHAIRESTDSIDQKMDNVKKETSSNPRKELANNGLPWTREGFMDVIRQDDFDMATLYARGGMKLEVEGTYGTSFLSSLEKMSDKMASLLAKYNSFKSGKVCGWVKNIGYSVNPLMAYDFYYKQIRGSGFRELITVTCKQKSEISALKTILIDKKRYLKNNTYSKEKSKCYKDATRDFKGVSPMVASQSAMFSKRWCDDSYSKSVNQVKKETTEDILKIEDLIKLMS